MDGKRTGRDDSNLTLHLGRSGRKHRGTYRGIYYVEWLDGLFEGGTQLWMVYVWDTKVWA